MNILSVLILAIVQGLTELLPVSSSAHVIVAGRFLGWDPSSPEGTFLLVMLHTGTMFAVLAYFWKRWKAALGEAQGAGARLVALLVLSTVLTGVVGYGLKTIIEKVFLAGTGHEEIEAIFSNLPLIACALAAAGALILFAGNGESAGREAQSLNPRSAGIIGVVQGLCLPFRGFSRSGATISTGMLLGVSKLRAEEFSFALAVILTPPVIARELHRLMKAAEGPTQGYLSATMLAPGLLGMVFSFLAGLLALRWLNSWIEGGRWKLFGVYCLVFSAVILALYYSHAI
jgi:undecaprenyl-diphosphatase